MALFILGLIVFFLPHYLTPLARGARAGLVKRFGAGGYKGLYSIVSAIGLALIVIGWRGADQTVLYVLPYGFVYVAQALTLLAMISLALAYMPRGKLAAALKHPMLLGVKLWAFGHLLVNGDVRSLLLFGSLLAYAVIDRIAVKRRDAPTPKVGPARNDAIAIAVGVALWAAIYFFLHRYIAGVALA